MNSDDYNKGWNEGIQAAFTHVMTLQTAFRNLLKDTRRKLLNGNYCGDAQRVELEHQVDQGMAIVGVLGDIIRHLAEKSK